MTWILEQGRFKIHIKHKEGTFEDLEKYTFYE